MSPDKNAGLIHKFDVQRVNDPDGKHADCRYFVLDPQHDPIAREALRRYMTVAREQGYVALADDLWAWIEKTDPTRVPKCVTCQRQRTVGDDDHPMDAYDYSPLQVVTGRPLGWYSGDDGEICPECMTQIVRGQ